MYNIFYTVTNIFDILKVKDAINHHMAQAVMPMISQKQKRRFLLYK